jgi:Bacterial extracellular solute-binding protein
MSIGAKRVLALVVAVVLILAAIGGRALLDGDDGGGSASEDDGGGGKPRLLCVTELEAVCNDLADDNDIEIEVKPAGVSVDEIASLPDDQLRDLGFDGWLTFSRDAEIATQRRERNTFAPATGDPTNPIARSPLVIGILRDRAAALSDACGNDVTWKCVGDFAGRPWSDAGGAATWGRVKPAHANPETTGEGLLVIGQAATNFYDGRTDLSIDDYASDQFLAWFSRLEDAVHPVPFEQIFTPGIVDIVGTFESVAGPALAAATRDSRERVRLLYPAPVATADVVYVPALDADGADDLGDLLAGDDGRAALARAGWRVDGELRAAGVPATPPLPPRENLPDAGSLQALLETWREVTG